jgi:entericidin A
MGCGQIHLQDEDARSHCPIDPSDKPSDRKTPMKKLILTLAALASIAVFTTACNTIEGAGKDVERAGEKIENSANRNR